MKAQAKAIIASVVVIALALTALSGVTYSWWSDSENSTINITTGTLEVSTSDYTVEGDSLKTTGENITADKLPSNIGLKIDSGSDTSSENSIFIKNDANFTSLDLTISYKAKFNADVPYRYIINVVIPTGVYATVSIDDVLTENLPFEKEGSGQLQDKTHQVTVCINAIDSGISSTIQFTNYITQQANNAPIVNIANGSANISSITSGQPAIITGTVTDTTTSEVVSVEASFNNIPSGAEVFSVSSSKDEGTGITTLDLSIKDAFDRHISNTGTVSIKVELPGEVANPVVLYNGSTESQPTIKGSSYNATTGKTTVIFETNHFSEYLIIDYQNLMPVSHEETLRLFIENGINCKLINDININSAITIVGQKITIDLNGFAINSSQTVFTIKNNSEVVIVDSTNNGKVIGGSGGDYSAISAYDSEVTLNGGYYYVGSDANNLGNSCINAHNSNINITDGTYETAIDYEGFYYVLNITQTLGHQYGFTVSGGLFVNYNPSVGDDALGGTFVAKGYTVDSYEQDGKTYYQVVKSVAYIENNGYPSLDSAITASSDGDTIIICEIGTYILPSSIPNKITIKGSSKEVAIDAHGPENVAISQITKGITLDNVTINIIDYNSSGEPVYNGYRGFHGGEVTINDCVINGKLTCYSKTEFQNCIFNLNLNADYIWTYGQNVIFDHCTFNTLGKAILIYDEVGMGETCGKTSTVSVTNCTFIASQGGKAGDILNQNCAAIEINNFGTGVTLTTNNNKVQKGEDAFSGDWRIKLYVDDDTIMVNGEEYTSTALDGNYFTVDNKNVIAQQS